MAELADSQASSPVLASSPAPVPLAEMVSQAIAELVATCTKHDSWSLSCPNKVLQTAPSSGQDFYVKPVGLLNEPLKRHVATTISEIGKGFKDVGKTKPGQASVLYNDTFWDQFFMSILFQIGGKLYNTYEQGREVGLRRELLTPLLEKAAHCAASLTRSGLYVEAADDVITYHSAFTLETRTEARQSRRGRKPQCDYAFSGWLHEEALYFIPIEATVRATEVHVAQLAHYMSTTPLGDYRRPYASVGLLIDQYAVRLAFSVMSFDSGGKILPLPLILITPQLEWRVESTAQKHVCVLLALLGVFHVERSIQDPDLWCEGLGRDVWGLAEAVAKGVDSENFSLTPHRRTEPYNARRTEGLDEKSRHFIGQVYRISASCRECVLANT